MKAKKKAKNKNWDFMKNEGQKRPGHVVGVPCVS